MRDERFVGRARELRELAGELATVAGRRLSRIVVLTGPAGIGKTRLSAEFRARTRRSAGWLAGRGAPGLSASRLGPILDAVPGADPSAAAIRLRLVQLTADGPLVLWLDDLHAADVATQQLVNQLGRAPLSAPLLLLGTLRTDALLASADVAITVGTLLKDGLARELRVPPLGEGEVVRIAELALGPAVVTADLGRWLIDRTRGNALLLTALLDDLGREPGRRSAAATVQERTRVLLASLSPAAVRAAEVAAVLGAAFTAPELLAVAGDAGPGVDRLVAAGLLVEEPETRHLEFAHPILQEAVYEMTGPARRSELHSLIAVRLSLGAGPRAYHLARGARPGDAAAVAALREAAVEAMRAGSPSLAVAHFRDALGLVPGADAEGRAAVLDELAGAADAAGDHTAGIPALQELLRLAATADERITTRLRLASFVSAGGGDLPEAERLVGEAVTLAQTASPARLAAALNELGWIRGEGGDLEGQVRFAGEALALGEAGGDAGAQLRALGPLAHAQMLLGRLGEARAANDRAVAMARSAGDLAQLEWHLSVRGEVLATGGDIDAAIAVVAPLAGSGRATTDVVHSNLVRYLWLAGRWEESLATARRLLAEAPTQVPVRTAWALALGGAVEGAAGRPEAARPLLALADRSYGGRDFYSFSALHDWGAGMAAWVLGDGDVAMVRLQRSALWLEKMGAVGVLPFVLADLCAVAALSDANQVAATARVRAERLNDKSSPVMGVAALACAALLRSRTAPEAAAAAEHAGLRVLAAMILMHGELDDIAEAARRFAAMPAPLLEARCRDMLRAAGSRGRRAAREAGSLTGREAEVVALARSGLTTASIAASLGIGERTVETHLSRAYAKLGISGRHELSELGRRS